MTIDKVKLRELAEAAIDQHGRWVVAGEPWPVWNMCLLEMQSVANPAAVLDLLAEIEQQDSKGPLCFCGLKQTKNPHPEAGVPPGYLEVGTVYDCIPCLNKSRRAWSKQANKVKGELADLQVELAKRDELIAEVMAAFRLEPDGSCINPGRDFIRPFAEKVAALSSDKKTGD